MMKEGFYEYRSVVYYGAYDGGQASGKLKFSSTMRLDFRTERRPDEGEWIAMLSDNHKLLEPEREDLRGMLDAMGRVINLGAAYEMDFSAVEARLGFPFPEELKMVYTNIGGHEEYFSSVEHFLPLDEIYKEQGVIVFFKKKRTPIAGYNIENGRLARYSKKEWTVWNEDICCYQFCAGRIFTIAMECRPVRRQGRCSGSFVSALNIEKELEKFCTGRYRLLRGLAIYTAAAIYSDNGLLAWIRSNGFYSDIHAGAHDEASLERLAEHLGEIRWK